MRYGHADKTQAEIVQALRDAGRTVVILSGVGKGVPDLLVGWGLAHECLMEVKSDKKTHHRKGNGLRDNQVEFAKKWRGSPVRVVTTKEEALRATGVVIG